MLGGAPQTAVEAPETGPKVTDRVGSGDSAPGTAVPESTPAPSEPANEVAAAPSEPAAPATASDPASLVAQRAILYDEAPDKQEQHDHACPQAERLPQRGPVPALGREQRQHHHADDDQ